MSISRRRFLRGAVALGAGWTVLPKVARASLFGGGDENGVWLGGDLHCHTLYSHDVSFPTGPGNPTLGDPKNAYTLGFTPVEQITNALARKLDFLAITDHDDLSCLDDKGYVAARDAFADVLTLIPGYEHSLGHGNGTSHAGCLGVTRHFDIDTPDDAGASALRDAVHGDGGIFIINHPFYNATKPNDPAWGYSPSVRPDSIEVWNIAWPYRKEIFGQIAATSENYKSLPWWESEFLAAGPMPATGGSDNHWRATAGAQGVGQPTTWVFARDRSWPAILDGIRAGRTTVSAEPPAFGGARLFLAAALGNDEFMVGDVVPSGGSTIEVRARVVGAPGQMLRFVVDGSPLDPITVTGPDFCASVELPGQNRAGAEVYVDEGYWMTALSSPIYVA
ncbi:MAG: CehA/McbA family metallohydrolase [Actinomycetota bacterium]